MGEIRPKSRNSAIDWKEPMPAAKPKALIVRHETKAELKARADKEAAFVTEYELPKGAPAELEDYPTASKTWRRLMREFMSIEESYVISLDRDMLLTYCMLIEQLEELDEMRKKCYQMWKSLTKQYEVVSKRGDFDQALEVAVQVSGTFDTILKLDARADQKRKTIFDLQKSLYMTPRARAGATPRRKAPE
jgi:phage terminase small subunit